MSGVAAAAASAAAAGFVADTVYQIRFTIVQRAHSHQAGFTTEVCCDDCDPQLFKVGCGARIVASRFFVTKRLSIAGREEIERDAQALILSIEVKVKEGHSPEV